MAGTDLNPRRASAMGPTPRICLCRKLRAGRGIGEAGPLVHAAARLCTDFSFLRFMLLDCSLYDREEAPFFLPRIPPEEDDWVRPGPEPEHGIRIHAKAVGPDGVIRPFAVGVSAPRPANDGYVAEIRYEWKEPPVRLVRGETCADCYFSGIDYIESRLDADQLTLLGLWNEPIPLPIRPKS